MRCHPSYSKPMANRRDFLDEIIDERSERNPEFPDLVEAALRRRQLLRELAARREKPCLSQTLVAARMGTSQSAVARLEAGEIDAKLSTVERFAAALGQKGRVASREGAVAAGNARDFSAIARGWDVGFDQTKSLR
jgi:ribosome-binding protein aMBF1 (putative translation factor)